MKSYLSLIPISAKVHRRRNKMTLICIIISVFLVTAVFSMADMGIRMERARLTEKHGNWHIALNNMEEAVMEEIGERYEVAASSWYDVMNYRMDGACEIQGKKAAVCGAEKPFITHMFAGFEKGSYPERENEIILSRGAERDLGLKKGDRAVLTLEGGSLEFVISGFCEDTVLTLEKDAVGAFVNKDAFQKIVSLSEEKTSRPVYFILFREHVNARKAIENIRKEYGLNDSQIMENTPVLGLMGFSGDRYVMGLYGAAGVLFVLVLLAGILMIAGSINSNIAGRTRFFGMLRCVGASRRQIIRFVHLEALNWCRSAVPIGVVTGILITWAICLSLRFLVGSEFSHIPLWKVSPVGIISGILVGVLTVLIAARAPAKRAARVSPIAAVSGNGENQTFRGGKERKRAEKGLPVKIEILLGAWHGILSGKTLVLMTGSFALSIILFLSFSVLVDFAEHSLKPLKPWAPDLSIMSKAPSPTVERELLAEVQKMPGVDKAFGRMYEGGIPASCEKRTVVSGEKENVISSEQGNSVSSEKDVREIDLISYEDIQLRWAEEDVMEGDLSRVKGNSGYVLAAFSQSSPLQAGDRLALQGEYEGTEWEIAAVLSDTPFDTDGTPTIICSEEAFMALTGQEDYAVIDIQLTKDASDEDADRIRKAAGSGYEISDRRKTNRDTMAIYVAFRVLVYGFLGIIGMIAACNIMNSISMSVSARIRQYGIMRAIGLEERQVIGMIAAEALTYALSGGLAGCLLGLSLHHFLFEQFVTNYWGTPWRAPLSSLGLILLLMWAALLAAVYRPAKRVSHMAVTETISEL